MVFRKICYKFSKFKKISFLKIFKPHPVSGQLSFKINDLTLNKSKINKKLTKKNNFILVISDFYYMDSANNLKNELIKKININNLSIKKINNNKYRLLVGPFESFNALKTTYISLNKLGFEDLNVYNE